MTDDQLTRDDAPDVPPDRWVVCPRMSDWFDAELPAYEDNEPEDLAEAA